MQTKPISDHLALAEHYYLDALDFTNRFDFFWERELHKSSRIKSFVDLLMASECVLKAHCVLGLLNQPAEEVYAQIRRYGHKISTLADNAYFLQDRNQYELIHSYLGSFSVDIRYSLDFYDIFFPLQINNRAPTLNYSATVGNNSWVLKVRECLNLLLDPIRNKFTGFVPDEIEAIFAHEVRMKQLVASAQKKKRLTDA